MQQYIEALIRFGWFATGVFVGYGIYKYRVLREAKQLESEMTAH